MYDNLQLGWCLEKKSLTTELDGIINCLTFQVKFPHSREVVAKKKEEEICTKTRPMCMFTVISFHLDVVVR